FHVTGVQTCALPISSAPKGGTMRLSVVGDNFDSFNPFVIKGVSAAGVGAYLYDSLMKQSGDEPFSEYGLIAEKIEMPEDRSWVSFHLNKAARFHDGHPITAEDVAFTFRSEERRGGNRRRQQW